RVGACIATLLAASGVARVSCRDSGTAGYADLSPGGLSRDDIGAPRAVSAARAVRRVAPEAQVAEDPARQPDLAVLAGRADPEEVTALLRARVPHIAVCADEAIGVVGPLVVPGYSACLRCADLTRAERDSAWPLILAQATGDASPRACDTVLSAGTAALAAHQVLAFIDQAGTAPATLNGTLELVLPDWQWRRRTWLPHPACTCRAYRDKIEMRNRASGLAQHASEGRTGGYGGSSPRASTTRRAPGTVALLATGRAPGKIRSA
ncbi:MAG: ThiF family adenylyltransferase, partial [Nocardiopsaceae bacterium]|nr:ThiF family adenylyltransferase [Nocardiopsaceae bacterium]